MITVRNPTDRALVAVLQTQLGAGESEGLALAMELGDVERVLDDKKARRIAAQLAIRVVGTLGVLVRAKRKGWRPTTLPMSRSFHGV